MLAFIPDFEQGKFKRALGRHKKQGSPTAETAALRHALMECGLVYGREWVEFTPKNLRRILNPSCIENFTAQELQTALTGILRMDRLGEGFVLSSLCQSGHVLATLKRLQTLHAEGQMTPLLIKMPKR
ncbi:MAG: hypothetical protein EP312_07160 [Gammaproteobacteria bacterium]|nr:MAG: hypothetical protein EP312_07160 [Gammaproteobacteria bacterium]